jgi:DNA-binding IclR family transcriptional regulator
VARAAGILFSLGNGQAETSLTALARQLGIHKSTAHGILATLAAYGLVERDPLTRRYRLGRALVMLGRAADRDDLEPLTRPHLDRLCRLSGETAAFHLRGGDGSVIVASAESPHQLKVIAPPGHALPRFAGAVAKVLHAFAGPAAVRLPGRLPAFTPQAITDPDRYRQELDRVRRAGVAYDDMEYLPGVRAISAPVFRGRPPADAEAIGAISIIGVAARVGPADLRRFARPLLAATRELSETLHPQNGTAPGRHRS